MELNEHSNPLSDKAIDVRNILSAGTPGADVLAERALPCDRFCFVYDDDDVEPGSLFTEEEKAPSKLTLDMIRIALENDSTNSDLASLADRNNESKDPKFVAMNRAAAMTQPYEYTLLGGLDYGCLVTGEATVYLRIKWDEPDTLYYKVSIPSVEAGQTVPGIFASELIHVGQMLALMMMALASARRPPSWRMEKFIAAPKWAVPEDDTILEDLPPIARKQGGPYIGFQTRPKESVRD